MVYMIKGGSPENPLYALQHTQKTPKIFIDTDSGIIACIRRLFLQIIGLLDYDFKHVTAHIAKIVDPPLEDHFKSVKVGQEMSLYHVRLTERDIQIMGRLAKIEGQTWRSLVDFGYELLQIASSHLFTTHDVIELKTAGAKQRHADIISKLVVDKTIQNNCTTFVNECPSLTYRMIVRLALKGSEVNTLSLKDALTVNSTSTLVRL